jgi:4-amino-4-deoxy-L-arabinose transferase-like glycosyltransferase
MIAALPYTEAMRGKPNTWLVGILLAYLVLAGTYAMVIRPFGSIDEIHHFNYVKGILENHQLPVLQIGEPFSAEEHQPPLYYVLAAVTAAVGLMARLAEITPLSQMSIVLYAARSLSILAGLATVWGTYRLAQLFFPQQRFLPLVSAALVAFNPSFIGLSASVTNDSFIAAFGTLTLVGSLTIFLGRNVPSLRLLVLTGLATGLGALSKLNIVSLLPALAIALLASAWRQGSARLLARNLGFVFGPALILSGWWFWRNWLLYKYPSAFGLVGVINPIVLRDQPPALADYPRFFTLVGETFWAAFGETANIRVSEPIYPSLLFICLLAFLGLGVYLLRQFRSSSVLPAPAMGGVLLLVLSVILNITAMIRYDLVYWGAAHGRYLYPTIAAISVLITLGLNELAPRRTKGWLPAAMAAGLLILAAAGPFTFLSPLRTVVPVLSEEEVRDIPHRLDIVFDGGAKLVGYRLDSTKVEPGGKLGLSLYWQGIKDINTDWTLFIHLLDAQATMFGSYDSRPLQDNYPTLFWRKGEVWKEHYLIPIDPQAHPGMYVLDVGFYNLYHQAGARSMVVGREASILKDGEPQTGGASFGKVRVVVPSPPVKPQHELEVDLDDGIRLIGWSWSNRKLTLYWQARTRPRKSYTVFTHLLDQKKRIVGQHDGIPTNGWMPTDIWEPRETIADEHPLEAPPGEYTLVIGMYDFKTGKRLSILDAAGRTVCDHITLGTVSMETPYPVNP